MSGLGTVQRSHSFLLLRFKECFAEKRRAHREVGGCSRREPLLGVGKWCRGRNQTNLLLPKETRAAVLTVRSQTGHIPSHGNLLEMTDAQAPNQTYRIRNSVRAGGAVHIVTSSPADSDAHSNLGITAWKKMPQKKAELDMPGFPWFGYSSAHQIADSVTIHSPLHPCPPSRQECPSWPHSYWAGPQELLWLMDLWAGEIYDATPSRGFRCACMDCLGLLSLCHPPSEPDVPDNGGHPP